jgi:hypothetical protein
MITPEAGVLPETKCSSGMWPPDATRVTRADGLVPPDGNRSVALP